MEERGEGRGRVGGGGVGRGGGRVGVQTRSPEQPPQPCGYRHTKSPTPRDKNGHIHLQLKPRVASPQEKGGGRGQPARVELVRSTTEKKMHTHHTSKRNITTWSHRHPKTKTTQQPPHLGRHMFTNTHKYLGCNFE